jgi:anti-anti-sigma factor
LAHEDDQFSWATCRGVAVVRASGEVDLSTAARLRTCCQAALESLGPEVGSEAPRVVVDLAETRFLDSSALGVLVGVAKQVDADGGWLRLAAAQLPIVRKVLEITQLDVSLGDYDTVEDAIDA